MNKLWVVLKVSLTRPWVRLMSIFPLFMFPLFAFTLGNWERSINQEGIIVAIPAFDVPEITVSEFFELKELGESHQLGTIEGLDCGSLPDNVEFNEQGGLQGPASLRVEPAVVQPLAAWYILDAVPQLKSLTFQPPNYLGPEGWQRIGKLHELEVLSLQTIGFVNQEAYKAASQELPAALASLTKLRQLNINMAGGPLDWALPPLPNLEYVVLGYNQQLETTLETLATHSPRLQTLALNTYENFVYTDRMLAALHRMPNLQRIYIVSSSRSNNGDIDEISRQVVTLRRQLPTLSIYRGAYSAKRLGLSALLFAVAAFFPFVAWFQSGLTLAQPLAAVMPGHRGPHLFWPVAISVGAFLLFVPLVMLLGVVWFVAIPVACLTTMLTATLLSGHDIQDAWRRVSNLVSGIDVLCLLLLIGLGFSLPTTMDGFLMGDHPFLAISLPLWFLFAAGWKVVRATRLHRILAESGMTGIPGLNLGFEHLHNQPFKPAPGWSMAGWQLKRMENAIDRRIANMNRSDWADMLRKASPSNIGAWFGLGMMITFMVVFRFMTRNARVPVGQMPPFIGIGAMQATMMILMMNTMMWVGRRGSIASDFLRPISRPQFWQALRQAILRDLVPAILFALVGGMYSVYMVNKGLPQPLAWANALVAATGFLALTHGWVVLLVIGKRLWLHATFAVVTIVFAASFSAASVFLTQGETADPLGATLSALGVLAAGVLMQWAVTRKLPDWELG